MKTGLCSILLSMLCGSLYAQRVTVPLDGTWQIEDSLEPGDMPAQFRHTAPVPGLANLAAPAFPDVDRFDSREVIGNLVRRKKLPESARTTAVGVPRQNRNYFWYRRTFTAPAKKEVALLRIAKAQFGTAVWLNGTKLGEHFGCFTAGYFNATAAIRWGAENTVTVRIGAHPAALPASVPAGTDFEKLKWTPGIYDSVTLIAADNPVIESVQVAPRIAASEALIQTVVKNYGAAPRTFSVSHTVAGQRQQERNVRLGPGEERTLTATLKMPNARLWSPDDPYLYTLESSTAGDSARTRFGMREIRFDTATKRCYLNGKVFFLRGSNITLHRFFEDPKCGRLPWDEKWVRQLLAVIPKRMNWNSFRFCIGPVPDKWLEIADEAGLLIQNEFFIWVGRDGWHKEWDNKELIAEYKEWMRDNWNHPSVAIWDAQNETYENVLGDEIIPAVRKLDLSNRAWENGYNLPAGPDDPVEDHPYLFGNPRFRITELERMTGAKSTNSGHPTGHAALINEYGWLWLNRDGTPTELTQNVYAELVGPNATPEERFKMDAYLLAGLTEFWRAHRNFAGVLHFVYLTASFPGAFTADHFRDVERLELEPNFAEWVREAFKPLGVYVNFWQPKLTAGAARSVPVMMINDEQRPVEGKLKVSFVAADGTETGVRELPFSMGPAGQFTYRVDLTAPATPGEYELKAAAAATGGTEPTLSRRRLTVTAR